MLFIIPTQVSFSLFSHCATTMLIRSSHLAPVNCEAKIHFNWQFF
jgi:hypothetical protein